VKRCGVRKGFGSSVSGTPALRPLHFLRKSSRTCCNRNSVKRAFGHLFGVVGWRCRDVSGGEHPGVSSRDGGRIRSSHITSSAVCRARALWSLVLCSAGGAGGVYRRSSANSLRLRAGVDIEKARRLRRAVRAAAYERRVSRLPAAAYLSTSFISFSNTTG